MPLTRLTSGRYEALCGQCLAPVSVPGPTEAEAVTQLVALGWLELRKSGHMNQWRCPEHHGDAETMPRGTRKRFR